jgi:CheY-like chemotaxis protein
MLSTAASIEPRSTRVSAHAQHHVLVVDDYAETRDAVATLLEITGAEVVAAESGKEALELLQAGLRPCVMLLDVRMPELDGWEVWDRMKQHRELALTSVVILSADPADVSRTRACGIREFLRKPVDGSRLLATVERHCEKQRFPFQ